MQSNGTPSKFRRTLLASAISLALAGGSGLAIAGGEQGAAAGGYGSGTQAQQPGMTGDQATAPGQDPAPLGQEDQATVGQDPTLDDTQDDPLAADDPADDPLAADDDAADDPLAADDPAADDQAAAQPGLGEQPSPMFGEEEITEEQARELVGKPLMGPDGEQIGQVERVVRDEQDQLALVVSEDSALGIGGTQRVITIDQIQLEEHASLSQEQDLAQMPEFDEQQYETVASADDAQDQAALGEQDALGEEEDAAMGTEQQPGFGQDSPATPGQDPDQAQLPQDDATEDQAAAPADPMADDDDEDAGWQPPQPGERTAG